MPDNVSSDSMGLLPVVPGSFERISHIVVLMLENRSFDHLLGDLNKIDTRVIGLRGDEFNYDDPNAPQPRQRRMVFRADRFDMPFDPPHEFPDVQIQLYGPKNGHPDHSNPPIDPAAMSGFVFRTLATIPNLYIEDAARVMSYFQTDQIPVLATLAQEFALFNTWYSSLPGPTWPNRFFAHAATSGGLNYSPSTAQIVAGFSFRHGTIYDRLGEKRWRIYHNGLPQSIGISSLRWNYLRQHRDPFGSSFRPMASFEADIAAGDLPEYTFIEPNYDTGNNFAGGDSMHPLNDIRKGELLVKRIYETLRNSIFWEKMMLIITFDEHGGFFDHISPPAAVASGDDHRYARADQPFAFDRLGLRVPALAISAFTQKGTVIGNPSADATLSFDHSSIPATVARRFGFPTLTTRDASARTLDVVINLTAPRLSEKDAPLRLPEAAPDSAAEASTAAQPSSTANKDHAPLSDTQSSFLALALACDLELSDVSQHQEVRRRYESITRQKQAADYIAEVAQRTAPARLLG